MNTFAIMSTTNPKRLPGNMAAANHPLSREDVAFLKNRAILHQWNSGGRLKKAVNVNFLREEEKQNHARFCFFSIMFGNCSMFS